jgi:glycosyltransferase involved in cell wall biosynthesis
MRVSVVLPDCQYLSKPTEASRHGAFFASAAFFKWVANDPSFEKLEVFLPPAAMSDESALKEAAETTLLPASRGRGRLSFYPVHHLPEVWRDGVPRILRSLDPQFMARDRYLRDSFAEGPVALSADTHVMASYLPWVLQAILNAPPVAYDSVQCISHSLRDAFRLGLNELGHTEPPFRLDVIPRPVDCNRFRPPSPSEKSDIRRAARIPDDANVVIYHSRVGPHSKADLYPLVQAFSQCSGSNDWIVVSGAPTSDTAYSTLEGWLNDAGLGARAVLQGSCAHEEVPRRLWAADFFVLPCDNPSEGLGVAPIEAMAAGLPVVVSDWDGMREAVRDGENGYLVPTYWVPGSARIAAFSPFTPHLSECLLLSQCVVVDQDALADRMRALLQDRNLRARMGAAARVSALALRNAAVGKSIVDTFAEQLRDAAAEPPEVRAERRRQASNIALPTNYQAILPGQATRALGPKDLLELTQTGRDLLAGKKNIPSYYEVGMFLGPQLTMQILELFSHGPRAFGDVAGSEPQNSFEDGNFAVAALLKRGAIRLCP